eukprot:2679991-Rhodomonas_salina.2
MAGGAGVVVRRQAQRQAPEARAGPLRPIQYPDSWCKTARFGTAGCVPIRYHSLRVRIRYRCLCSDSVPLFLLRFGRFSTLRLAPISVPSLLSTALKEARSDRARAPEGRKA